ncbi:MAG: phosphate ABC transporter permease PstA [Deltaproteobacteria bacterium]|jgi:phosphate transport system permease protein|nr:phosphate ABC transporter permease PstA [Deltaproteobacteria bacterium]
MKTYWRTGEPCVWGTGAALAATLLIAFILIIVVMINGLGVFWPAPLEELHLKDGSTLLGERIQREPVHDGEGFRRQYKIANRDLYGLDFRWIDESNIVDVRYPDEAIVLEREEHGDFFGYLKSLDTVDLVFAADIDLYQSLLASHRKVSEMREAVEQVDDEISKLSYKLEKVRRNLIKAEYQGLAKNNPKVLELKRNQAILQDDFKHLVEKQNQNVAAMRVHKAVFADTNGQEQQIILADMVRIYQPNQMGLLGKSWFYAGKLKELILGQPRESNTEGGLFPAIFGTVMLIFVMSLFSFPLGVIAAIYLREYAREGMIVRLVRIAVNNLAGIPSIVYGIFGLGFFVYGVGGAIDQMFYPEILPTPTFGTGGILWASLTLALLTVPVVIVATEGALGAIPREIREGSLALGATKFQTLMRILLPMSSPGIMTGLILAMARAAGEVAPLMITGVVKLAPALPIDGNFPFLHLDRKFMHLGFHIFDIGFQSPNVEAAKPMVFVTTLLLVLIVLTMSSIAIHLRNKMKKRYTFGTF